MSLSESQENYYAWTNKLLTACRTRATRAEEAWHYVQVTERQKRGHPHSHILTTWKPHDLVDGFITKWHTEGGRRVKELVPALRSPWLEQRCISAGLGNQYEISQVRENEAASRYVSKYLFKPEMLETVWPKGWKRVRYSQSFPKLPEPETEAIALIKAEHWLELAKQAVVVTPRDQAAAEMCDAMLWGHDVLIKTSKSKPGDE